MDLISHARRKSAPGAVFAGLLFILVTGVLGMHGLDSHGVGVSHAAVAEATALANHHPATSMTALPRQVQTAGLGHAHPGAAASMGELCLAVLYPLLMLLLLVVALRRRGSWQLGRASAVLGSMSRGRDRDPPSLTQLSVRRC